MCLESSCACLSLRPFAARVVSQPRGSRGGSFALQIVYNRHPISDIPFRQKWLANGDLRYAYTDASSNNVMQAGIYLISVANYIVVLTQCLANVSLMSVRGLL